MKKRLSAMFLFIFLTGCLGSRSTPVINPQISPTNQVTQPAATSTLAAIAPQSAVQTPTRQTATTQPTGSPLASFNIDWTQPFAGDVVGAGPINLTTWTAQPYAGQQLSLPLNLSQLANPAVLANLTAEQQAFLAQNGFVVLHSQEAQFGDIREATALRTGQPYYLTTDAAYHALHLLFDDLLKAMEREALRPRLLALTQATLQELRLAQPAFQGSTIESEARQALAYLSVGARLLDPTAAIDPAVDAITRQQVEQILAAGGRARSLLFPDFEDDFAAYQPVGHYAGDPELEAYFRGMTWFGRLHFRLADPDNPTFTPSRLPLIVTLALRRAELDGQPASAAWSDMHTLLSYLVGPSDDPGPPEYAALMDAVYGSTPQYTDLADDARWQQFLARSAQLPAPQINSLFVASVQTLAPQKGWRFMGQRFTLDSFILQNVMFDKLEPRPDGTRRELPSGLDVMAAFGSQPALAELEKAGVTGFPNYPAQLAILKQAVQAQPEAQWLGRFYDSWLYSIFPLLQTKDSAYPAVMQTTAWGYKDLNTALGSWAELKHDTQLYTKMPEMAGGGGPPMSEPAPGYVEPNPAVFYRLSAMARTLSCGLQERVLNSPCWPDAGGFASQDMAGYINAMYALGARFQTLGDIAARELAGQPLSEEQAAAINACLGFIECMNTDTGYNIPAGEMPKLPLIAAVAGAQEHVLEVGVGGVDRIYVVVPLEEVWLVAQGGIFSYYEFSQPRSERLSDDAWRQMLATGQPSLPDWAANFVLPGGAPAEALFFRIGDIYIITKAGDRLNLRQQPGKSGALLKQLKAGDYVEIIDGPLQKDGYTWWKLQIHDFSDPMTTGWAVEDPQWYVRSYRPDQVVE